MQGPLPKRIAGYLPGLAVLAPSQSGRKNANARPARWVKPSPNYAIAPSHWRTQRSTPHRRYTHLCMMKRLPARWQPVCRSTCTWPTINLPRGLHRHPTTRRTGRPSGACGRHDHRADVLSSARQVEPASTSAWFARVPGCQPRRPHKAPPRSPPVAQQRGGYWHNAPHVRGQRGPRVGSDLILKLESANWQQIAI